MPKKTIHTFPIERLEVLNQQGDADPRLEPHLSPLLLRKMFEDMILTREFDRRAVNLQRQGKMGPYAVSLGQEAILIGTASAMDQTDWAVPCFREQGVYLSRGVKASSLFLFFMGSEEGNRLGRPCRSLPYCVPCASQILHAVGIGMAAKIKKDPVGVVVYFGDGATSEGDFHEGLNFAGVFQTPTVLVCQNNQWAISTPLEAQTRSATIAQKAVAYGIDGLQVDGNDVLAVYRATEQALQKARRGEGPTLIECLTYRMGAHTTSDDPSRYRDASEVEAWLSKDPVDRFEKYLLKKGVLQEGDRKKIASSMEDKLRDAAVEAEFVLQRLTPDEMFTYLYHHMPEHLKSQMEEALRHYAEIHREGVVHG